MSTYNPKPLHLIHRYSISPEAVFDAWLKPELVKLWMFKSASNEIVSVTIDAKTGGRFSILELNNGEEIDHYGEYIEVKRPTHLAFTLEVPWHFSGISCVIIEISEQPYGCELSLTQTGIDTTKTEDSWRKMLNDLQQMLEKKVA